MTTENIPNKDSTLQEIESFVVRNLRKQGKQSLGESKRGTFGQVCMYRSPDGCKCAAGWLIPDDKYLPAMEGMWVAGMKFFYEGFDDRQITFIGMLQDIHDNGWETREEEWQKLFEHYGLTLAGKQDSSACAHAYGKGAGMSKSFFACGSQHSMTELRLVLLDLGYTSPQASHQSVFNRAELGCVPGYSDNGTSLWILWSDGDESTGFLTGFAACWMLTRGDNQ